MRYMDVAFSTLSECFHPVYSDMQTLITDRSKPFWIEGGGGTSKNKMQRAFKNDLCPFYLLSTNVRLWLAKILTSYFKRGKKTRRQSKTQHTQDNIVHTGLVYTWWMRSRKTYSAAYHKKHTTLTCQYISLFSQERKNQKDITTTKHITENFLSLFACNQYVLNKL